LYHHQVGRGDKVAIISNNRVEWAVAMYAVTGVGAQLVPMYEAQLKKALLIEKGIADLLEHNRKRALLICLGWQISRC
jgi:acyl-CoA synthetase (AMP-forming)/AMP-acid ligase II